MSFVVKAKDLFFPDVKAKDNVSARTCKLDDSSFIMLFYVDLKYTSSTLCPQKTHLTQLFKNTMRMIINII